jgi:hypothetical protein
MLQAPEGRRLRGTYIVVGFSSVTSTVEESIDNRLAREVTDLAQRIGKRRCGSVDLRGRAWDTSLRGIRTPPDLLAFHSSLQMKADFFCSA